MIFGNTTIVKSKLFNFIKNQVTNINSGQCSKTGEPVKFRDFNLVQNVLNSDNGPIFFISAQRAVYVETT